MPRVNPSIFFLLLLALVATGCTVARKKVDGDMVANITFHGRSGVSGVQLRGAMGQKKSSFGVRVPLLKRISNPVALDRRLLDQDSMRIETWLAHNGYFDARFLGWRIERRRAAKLRRDGTVKKAGVVTVRGLLDQGEVSQVRSFDIVWLDVQAARVWRSAQARTVERTGYIQPGGPFVLDLADYTRDLLHRGIQDHGHAYGQVSTRFDAYPEQHAVDVTFDATTGPVTVYGEIGPEHDGRVSWQDIRTVLDLHEGDSYSATALQKAQQRLVELGVFSLVRIEPDLTEPGRTDVPIRIDLTEGRFGRLRSGFGLVYDGTTVTPRISGTVEHSNIDGHLARFQAGANLGLGFPVAGGPVRPLGGFEVGVTRPRAFGEHWDTNAQLSFQRDLLSGQLLYSRAKLLWGVSARLGEGVALNLGPSFTFNKLGGGSLFGTAELGEDDKLLAQATFGDTQRQFFVLTTLESSLTIDWRKMASGQDPRGGWYYVLGARQALPFAREGAGSYRFTDLYGEARFYRSILSPNKRDVPITLALRLKGKWLPSLRQGDLLQTIPYSERAFLGGSLDMRGFRINQVGPYDCVCLARSEEVTTGLIWPFTTRTGVQRLDPNPTYLPRGGRVSGLVSGEARLRFNESYGMAVFGDVGVLGASTAAFRYLDKALRWDLGIGYRQQTPVGPIRFDLAFRPSYPEDIGPLRGASTATSPQDADWYRGTTYGCDAFGDNALNRRVPGLGVSSQWDRSLPPVVINIAIAIGEAI